MHNIKMIVTDLDRTLLREDKTISNYTSKVLKKYGKNLKIICATARPFRTVQQFCNQVNFDFVICHNGAVIYEKEKIINKHSINANEAKKFLLNIASKFPETKIAIEINDILYANFDSVKVWEYDDSIYTNFIDLPNIDIDKIIIVENDGRKAKQFLKYLPSNTYMQNIENKMFIIINKNATKYNAIKSIGKDINLSDIIAFGDDHNDIEMIRKCGIGVCVENGINEAKQVADYICGTNENDGVAKWLEKEINLI